MSGILRDTALQACRESSRISSTAIHPSAPARHDAMLTRSARAVQRTMVQAKIGAGIRDGEP